MTSEANSASDSDPAKPSLPTAAPKRPRRSPYQSMVEEIMAEEEAWKAKQEAARVAAGNLSRQSCPRGQSLIFRMGAGGEDTTDAADPTNPR